ncbi:hypothetical protein ANOM_009795 [Aspergillus nomiae NRRL 13137]|uniref:Uncharacterized protein n=1 Tax=Aspergillus nomiae NRRL (strain ATCC 15546 / NRRL 13137 / CBS 260.88 / M93) TaxID=1509407 RepID=A0A0L1INW3_ASPN3|nr:uncharacterized protein ANOM_009795 [Aspergillus nomiae NRRL 13137]KNG81179.1 hypothetical protein ANOM_009795 [Aspergillus nomiae NRRL 13137]
MLSPNSLAVPRQAPPVRPSRSLEGLEKVVPPHTPQPAARSALRLDKPLPELPAKPLPETPSMESSMGWSDDSSTDVSFETRRTSDASSEGYPVCVRSPSDTLDEFVEHSPISSIDRSSPVKPYNKPEPSPLTLTTLCDDHHRPRPLPTATRAGPNHYFREKKWEFFPELAMPSDLPPGYPKFPPAPRKQNSNRLNLAAFDFTKISPRCTSPDKRALALDVRKSIRSYVQRRLSKNSIDKTKPKRRPRASTAPSEFPEEYRCSRKTSSSNYSNYSDRGSTGPQQNFLYLSADLKRLSMGSSSSEDESDRTVNSIKSYQKKQPVVRISAYQRYGPVTREKPGREKRISYRQRGNVRFPKYRKQATTFQYETSSKTGQSTCSTLQQGTRFCVRVLQDGTSHVLIALDEARQKIIQAQVDRRRRQLKSKIRLIGPVNPYTTYGRVDPWI